MQLLYTLSRDEELSFNEVLKLYDQHVDESYQLLLYNIYVLIEITRNAEVDYKNRRKKHLPSDYDKVFTDKLFSNETIQGLIKNKSFQALSKKFQFSDRLDLDLTKKIYLDFSKEKEYENYILKKDSSKNDNLNILLEMYRYCRKSEIFEEMLVDQYLNYEDDKSLIVGGTKKILKSDNTASIDFAKEYYPEEEIVQDFGKILLKRTFQEENTLSEIIKPQLKNWDHDRVAIIDMILIKMAAIEFQDFETIPTKVTINEYLDISKDYSTPKSNEFINGMLDTILVKLTEEGKVNKSGRGLKE